MAFFFALFTGLNGGFLCLQRENKESRSPRSGAVDLPMVTDSIRNIKSMWEKGNVFNSPGGGGSPFKVWCTRALCSATVGKERKEVAGLAGTSCVAPAASDVQAELTFGPSFFFLFFVKTGSSCDEDRRGGPHQRLAE